MDYQQAPASEYHYTVCERNKNQILRLLNHDFSVYEEIVAEDIRIHGPATGQETIGIEASKKVDMGYAVAYPNAKYTIHDILAVGDKVVVRWSVEGTHTGERKALRISGASQDLPPTNRDITVNGVHIYRFNQDGKLIDSWAMWDRLGEIEQIADITITAKPL